MSTETADLIARSGLVESPPDVFAALCDVTAGVLGDPASRVEVVLATPSGRVRVAGRGAPLPDDSSHEAHEVPVVSEDSTTYGALRVWSEAGEVPGDSVSLAGIAAAVATACDLEVARTRLFDADERAALAEEKLTEAVGQVVHDLNNPLAAAAMSLEIAREQVGEGLVAQLLDRAIGSAEKMKRMTATMLTFSHRSVPGTADVGEVLTALAEEFEGLPAGAVTVEGELPTLAISPPDLEVVLVALLENAAKFATDERAPEISVRAERAPVGWRVVVRDNGRGIAADDLERAFEPTVRIDRRVPGMGLGLPTVRRIVRGAGGEAGATPLAVGTEVWFELPEAGPQAL